MRFLDILLPASVVIVISLLAVAIWALFEMSSGCAAAGGTIRSTFLYLQPIVVDKVVIYTPIYEYTCEMPNHG